MQKRSSNQGLGAPTLVHVGYVWPSSAFSLSDPRKSTSFHDIFNWPIRFDFSVLPWAGTSFWVLLGGWTPPSLYLSSSLPFFFDLTGPLSLPRAFFSAHSFCTSYLYPSPPWLPSYLLSRFSLPVWVKGPLQTPLLSGPFRFPCLSGPTLSHWE